MPTVPSSQFPFKDSDGNVRQGQTLPLDADGNLPIGIPDGKAVSIGARTDSPPANVAAVAGSNSVIGLLKAIAGWALAPILGAGEAHVGQVGGDTAIAVASTTRPADTTAYASGDLVANSVTLASVVPLSLAVARKNGGTGRISRARLSKSGTAVLNANFRVHIYRNLPALAAGGGDNVALMTDSALGYLGAFDVAIDRVFSDGAKGFGVPLVGPFVSFECAAGSPNLYALIEARGAYAPASGEVFTLALEVDRD